MSAADVVKGVLQAADLSFELLDEKGEVWGGRTPGKRTAGGGWEVVFAPRREGVIEAPWVRGFHGDDPEPQVTIKLREYSIRITTMIEAVRVVMDIPRMIEEVEGELDSPPAALNAEITKRIEEARKVGVRAIPVEIDAIEAITASLRTLGDKLAVAQAGRAVEDRAIADLVRRLNKAEAEVERWRASTILANSESDRRRDLLREAASLIAYMLEHGEWYEPEAVLARLDAELKGRAP